MDAQKQKSKSLVHDLNNKMALMKNFLYLKERGLENTMEEMLPIFDRINELLQQLGEINDIELREDVKLLPTAEFCEKITQVIKNLQGVYPHLKIAFMHEGPLSSPYLRIPFEKNLVSQIVENALDNASNAGAENIIFLIRAQKEFMFFQIHDDGVGFKGSSGSKFSPLGYGSRIIALNCRRLGVEWHYRSAEGKGTKLCIRYRGKT
jgi:signal transduction histidine kinase